MLYIRYQFCPLTLLKLSTKSHRELFNFCICFLPSTSIPFVTYQCYFSLPLLISIVNHHKFCKRWSCYWGMVGQYLNAFFGIVMTWGQLYPFALSLWPLASTIWTFFSRSLVFVSWKHAHFLWCSMHHLIWFGHLKLRSNGWDFIAECCLVGGGCMVVI